MNARRYPRTLQQAFGPYTSSEVHPMKDETPIGEQVMGGIFILVCIIVAAVLGAYTLAGGWAP